MNLNRFVFREILHRKLNFTLGVVSVCVAVATLVGALTILEKNDRHTERIITAKEAETQAKMAAMEDDYRKITLGLGFNVLILPQEQNLSDLFAEDYAKHYMPEEYVERVAQSRIATIQHLLPSLQQKLTWPEYERTIILIGVRGEVPIQFADPKKPLLQPVPAGTMTVGYELHRSLKLNQGDKVKLLGREFSIGTLQPERGTKDDITVWINLKEAQELLDKKGQINGILALECVCAPDSLDKVRADIARILPDTQVIEFQSQTLARAEARQRAATEARDAVEREKQNRARLRQERASFAAVLVPVVVLGAGVWIALLSFSNVRERRPEIGLLRALGLRSRQILAIFLSRALLMGLIGGGLGCLAGVLIGAIWRENPAGTMNEMVWLKPVVFATVLAASPVLAALASWIPSLLAAQQDPAEVLCQE